MPLVSVSRVRFPPAFPRSVGCCPRLPAHQRPLLPNGALTMLPSAACHSQSIPSSWSYSSSAVAHAARKHSCSAHTQNRSWTVDFGPYRREVQSTDCLFGPARSVHWRSSGRPTRDAHSFSWAYRSPGQGPDGSRVRPILPIVCSVHRSGLNGVGSLSLGLSRPDLPDRL